MTHKNKTLTTFLAVVFGGLGAHRFYLHGTKDIWGWLHLLTLPLSVLLWTAFPGQPGLFTGAPLILSGLIGMLEALVIGLTPDQRWDATYNSGSGTESNSGWPVILLLILAMGSGTTGLIAAIARTFDLLFTGGAYG